MNQRMMNARAFVMTQELVDLCQNILAPEERQMAFEAFFDVCKNHLEVICIEQDRMQRRLRPLNN
jgi:hypothetical protein